MRPKRFALALAGPLSAGKTSVARAVAQQTGARWISFGEYVRFRAAQIGRSIDRDSLQELGQSLLHELGPDGLCHATLAAAGGDLEELPVVWDGVRHVAVAETLRELYGPDLRLVYLDPPRESRRARLQREAGSEAQLARWEADATEAEGQELRRMADVVCTAADVGRAVEEVLALALAFRQS